MHFLGQTKIAAIALLMFFAFSSAEKAPEGKIREATGTVEMQKAKQASWKLVRQGKTVHQGDKIRTGIESQAQVGLPDGSIISIEENSMVEFSELFSESGVNRTLADVKKGKIRFDVQKQTNTASSFRFKTGTAAAAIRGTAGVFGQTSKGKPIAALRNGKLEISVGANKVAISGGETAIPNGDNFVVLQLASSGDLGFLNAIDSILSDSTKSLDDLKKAISSMDSVYQIKQKAAQDSLKCTFETLPDSVKDNTVAIKGTCPAGIFVEIGGERVESKGEPIQFNPTWDAENEGPKKFQAICYAGKLSFECGNFKTFYEKVEIKEVVQQPVKEFRVTTKSPIKVCESDAVTIEGEFDPAEKDAKIFVKLGNFASPNLVETSADGKFAYTVSVNDQNKNWNETKATVEYHTKKSGKSETKKVVLDLDVNKSCPNVNQGKPQVLFQNADSLRCKVMISLGNVVNDIVILSSFIDGIPQRESAFTKNTSVTFQLNTGSHLYKFTAMDQAGNTTTLEKQLGCYPKSNVSINVTAGNYEKFRVPPPPQGMEKKFYANLRFNISNVPQNDPNQIKQITVSQKGNNLLMLQGSTQITQLDHDVQVELKEGKTTVQIKVEMKNGKVLTKTKTYEVY